MFDSQIVSRWFFEPSSHAIPTDKTELVVKASWGHVQLWRDLRYRAAPSRRSDGELLILRFLGSRGRAELATADPGDRLESLGAEVWTVNPPGFGASTGPTSLARYARCALVAADAILAHAEGRPVWIYGKSIGASAALLVAAERPIDCLIVKNAVPVERLLARRHGWWNLWIPSLLASLCIPSDLNCMHNARHSGARALFVMASEDSLSPLPYQRALFDVYSGPKEALHVRGGHDDPQLSPKDESEYRARITSLAKARRGKRLGAT